MSGSHAALPRAIATPQSCPVPTRRPHFPQNAEIFTLTYGSMVRQLIADYEDVEEVNKQLDKMCAAARRRPPPLSACSALCPAALQPPWAQQQPSSCQSVGHAADAQGGGRQSAGCATTALAAAVGLATDWRCTCCPPLPSCRRGYSIGQRLIDEFLAKSKTQRWAAGGAWLAGGCMG